MANIVKEPKRKAIKSEKTFAVKEQLRIGSEISAALPQRMSQSEVARRLGISQQMVCKVERRALFKLRTLFLELANKPVVGAASSLVESQLK